jgi:hypothetical protein
MTILPIIIIIIKSVEWSAKMSEGSSTLTLIVPSGTFKWKSSGHFIFGRFSEIVLKIVRLLRTL